MVESSSRLSLLLGVAVAALAASPAAAWHEQGHKDVGRIAQELIQGHRAAEQARAILGNVTLEQAGPWGDCVREVRGPPSFRYRGNPRRDSVCRMFADDVGLRDQMRHYVRNNWSQCPHTGRGCHTQYHFVNLAIQRSEYQDGQVGVHPHDLVQGIRATARVLSRPSCSRSDPSTNVLSAGLFRFTCAEALMMLVHFIGDLHQPLHVGSLYLDQAGNRVDPDSSPSAAADASQTTTRGGNLLHFTNNCGSTELHGSWDDTNEIEPEDGELASVPVTSGPPNRWAVRWANESLVLAREALTPLRFGARHSDRHGDCWTIQFANQQARNAYRDEMRERQREQVVKGGVHLAQLLLAIWPDQ